MLTEMHMLSLSDIRQIALQLRYKDWGFRILGNGQSAPDLQLQWMGPDSETGELAEQHSRKWRLSFYMTRSEIVQTAFKAVLTAEEHEVREHFRYRGAAILGPHFDVDQLVEMMPNKDVRK